jgi:CBS domain-containing protein
VKKTLVRDVMTTAVVTAGETMPYRHLVGLLYAGGIGAVPVIDPERRVLGVVSAADLAAKQAATAKRLPCPRRRRERRKARARTAGQLMTAPAVTVTPAATIGQAASIMRSHRVGRLPVTDPLTGRLAGIVTRSDLLRVYLRPGEEIRAEIEAEVLPRVPALAFGYESPLRGRRPDAFGRASLCVGDDWSLACRVAAVPVTFCETSAFRQACCAAGPW